MSEAYDWKAIEEDYRAGLPFAAIEAKYGAPKNSVRRKAVYMGWTRNQTQQVKQEVIERLTTGNNAVEPNDPIAKTAAEQVEVVLAQRKDVTRLRKIVDSTAESLQRILNGTASERDALTLGRGGVVGAVDTLGSALQRLIPLERAAYGIDLTSTPQEASEQANEATGGASVTVYLPQNHRDPKSE